MGQVARANLLQNRQNGGVCPGAVAKGELLAQAAPDGLSANIHASIDGVVTEITPAGARLCRKEV